MVHGPFADNCLLADNFGQLADTPVTRLLRLLRRYPGLANDERLTLKTSSFETLYGGQFTLSTQLIKKNQIIYMYQDILSETHHVRLNGQYKIKEFPLTLCLLTDSLTDSL